MWTTGPGGSAVGSKITECQEIIPESLSKKQKQNPNIASLKRTEKVSVEWSHILKCSCYSRAPQSCEYHDCEQEII